MHEAYVELKDHFIPGQVWSGFCTLEEILEAALEATEEGQYSDEPPDEVDEELVSKLIQDEFDKKAEAERTWADETDCDRLTKAFETLTSRGILSAENLGYTMSDAWSDWNELVYDEWKAAGLLEKVRGGCVYHGQDVEGAIAGRELWLAHSACDGFDGVSIAQEICDVLRKHGFKPEWNGDVKQRIAVPLKWQRRFGLGADTDPNSYQ